MSNLHLKNFARIEDSHFDIKDITVFAGKPTTGKSYIMKLLYAIDEGPNKINVEIDHASELLNSVEIDKFVNEEKNEKQLTETEILEIKAVIKKINQLDVFMRKEEEVFTHTIKNILESTFGDIDQISEEFFVEHPEVELEYKENKLTITLKEGNQDEEELNINTPIFVETPLILEFKKFMNRSEGKIPYHIDSLLKILDKDYSFTDEEQDEFIKSFIKKSKKIINGNIKDNGDSFTFQATNGKNYDIVNTSSGTKSIGLLQYLVTNKALKKGSILYWEEPEVHLHPKWQLKMVELFVELMKNGVKIIFSTHSPFMADYLNALSIKKNFNNRIAFNLLSEDNNIVSNKILDEGNWNLLQDELLNTLEDIMWQYL